jgi:hypothetical protein
MGAVPHRISYGLGFSGRVNLPAGKAEMSFQSRRGASRVSYGPGFFSGVNLPAEKAGMYLRANAKRH